MQAPINRLPSGRVVSLDVFRGLTFVLMLFVNFLAGASGIPAGIHHVTAEVDGMGLADVVFPAFLFAVGMSIPFALNGRIGKGDTPAQLQRHVGWRAASLIMMGLFMVNMESGYNEQAMGMPIALWALAFYAAVALVWGAYRCRSAVAERLWRAVGLFALLALAALYRGGDDGSGWMTTQWWGILGCIGWAYLAGSLIYQLARGRALLLAFAIGLCVALFAVSSTFNILHVSAMHGTHTSIVLAGLLCALLFFDLHQDASAGTRLRRALVLAVSLASVGYLLHLVYPVSKIGGTPPWALYCAALCCGAFALLYWLTEMRQLRGWTALVEPAASSPLVTYLIPFVLGSLMALFDLSWPAPLVRGTGALLFALVFSAAVVALVGQLNTINCKLKL
ncbi:DUF5009 domain-containing protein [Massilia sp. CF038]|uniref:DUF5009 domain-containing protein n=1 Tax=Massilia sp. CF038 TaxID=1881045 RepID=UPI00091CB87D|nr:DUF5009 domain-containing protein [Massilia sp. CF038]SHH01476.1 Predicted acyltransferase [Massilia sp. CF038]